ncbi:MAG: response regulator transcription factor [Comamonas sp.]
MQHLSAPCEFTVAIVDDDESIRADMCGAIEEAGLHAWAAPSAEDFYVSLLHRKADLVVAGLGLPGEGGLSLVQRLATRKVPAIVLTSRGDLESRIAGLNAGALQYFVKPADTRELVAGIRSILRHTVRPAAEGKPDAGGEEAPSWQLSRTAAFLIAPNLCTVQLTGNELALMHRLVSARGELVGKAELLQALGYLHEKDAFHRVESQLTRLRRKTLQATGMVLPVRNVFGKGFIFMPEMEVVA